MVRPLRPEFTPEESVAPEGSDGAHSANSILKRIAQRLHARCSEDAVRLFFAAQEQHLLSSNGTLLDELLDLYGRDLTAQLISAIAHFPCPACKDGLEPCTDCESKGIRYEGAVCETCIGTGRTGCSFCGGSGLATYSSVPVSLRYPVFAKRIHMLSRRIAPVIGQDVPATAPSLQELLLSLNKLLLAFEDAVIASDSILDHDPHLAHPVGELLHLCHRAPQQLQPRMRSILRRLAHLAGGASDAHKANFYIALADSTAFAGTGLHHPMLCR